MQNLKINPRTLGQYIVPPEAASGVCIDVGANVGNFFGKHNGFRLVHAYEPILRCFNECLRKATGRHHIHVFQQAITDRQGIVKIMQHKTGFAGSSSVLGATEVARDWPNAIGRATCIDLQTAIDRTGEDEIDYLKIDCECSEHAAMVGKDLSRIRHIGIEIHWQLGQQRFQELVDHISKTHRWDRPPRWRARGHNERLATRNDLN